ncbi:hypothetical protein [Geodermatophilus sabuli]|uniref:Uncharacterized protein n=1 Tax=Geodermatophilus sabuli TaxID=1564158 RepID=A0A285EF07_9ACTN|nr:hypothetical protein [Geodermatophilus sabuli]MBB3086203.1 hypothetical protein [Geodermatophilus sabuli]SNX97580.1 hypothetical protein SAMN06893097_107224 [Geodermatophilus sabuli]
MEVALLVVGAVALGVLLLSLVIGEIGDLAGVDVAALLRRLGGAGTGSADGVTRVPIVPADGDPAER